MRSLLHVGCGPATKADTLPVFMTPEWREIRFDLDPVVKPDVIGSITDLSAIPDASVDAIYSSHNIEHLFAHEVPLALREFLRVLKPDGFAMITCPDLGLAAKLVAEGKLLEPVYSTVDGPITPFDIIFGHRGATFGGNAFMAHRSGFTLPVLLGVIAQAGFPSFAGFAAPAHFSLWAVARKNQVPETEMVDFALGLFKGSTVPLPAR